MDAKPKKENKVAKKEKIVSSDDNSEADSEFSDDGEVSLDEMSLSDSDVRSKSCIAVLEM